MNLIKQEQDKAGIEMMNNAINSNNYEDEISNIENKLNQFLDEQNFKFDNSIKEIYTIKHKYNGLYTRIANQKFQRSLLLFSK